MASWPTLAAQFEELDRERRRIEGALHDGVQQDLVAASVALQFALEQLDTDPASARKLLEELEQQIEGALERVRALARGIYPSLLQAYGLAHALRAVGVEASVNRRYPLAVEETVYFACRALADGAARVWEEGDDLRFEVEGVFDDAALAHAQARVADAGGQLTVSAGGVTATVPASASAR